MQDPEKLKQVAAKKQESVPPASRSLGATPKQKAMPKNPKLPAAKNQAKGSAKGLNAAAKNQAKGLKAAAKKQSKGHNAAPKAKSQAKAACKPKAADKKDNDKDSKAAKTRKIKDDVEKKLHSASWNE